jgi:uncharacterized protein YkwD
MRRLRLALCTALAVAFGVCVAPASAVLPSVAPTYDATQTARLLSLVNAHRRGLGLVALRVDTRLADIAKSHTLTMATTGDLVHNDALFTRASHLALGLPYLGENIAYTSGDLDRAHANLLASPPHRRNIETGSFVVAGFGVVIDAKGQTWVTEVFGTPPRVTAPAPGPAPVVRPAVAPQPRVVRVVRPAVVRKKVPAPTKRVVAAVSVPHPRSSDRVDAPLLVKAASAVAVTPDTPSGARPGLAWVAGLLLGTVGAVAWAARPRRGRLGR